MSSNESRIGDAIASLSTRLEAWGVSDPAAKAHEFVNDMLRNGWRTTPNRVETPPNAWKPASDDVAAQVLAQMRAELTDITHAAQASIEGDHQ